MQKVQDDDPHRPAGEATSGTAWVGQGPEGVARWTRRDWATAVGWLPKVSFTLREQETSFGLLSWTRVEIPEFYLGHRASLLLLQGLKLGDLLVPNHELLTPEGEVLQVAHLFLGVDPWIPYEVPVVLRNLKLASLDALPLGLESPAVLDILVRDALRPA